jgi:hypothetical protein
VLNLWHAYVRAAQVGWDANVVVAMRLMRLAVGGALAQREAQRMVAEGEGYCDRGSPGCVYRKIRLCNIGDEDRRGQIAM